MSLVEKPLFSARLTPHRSLSHANFRLLLLIFSGAALVTSLPFIFLGAWPVMGFMGLDVVLFYVAFRANYRDARAYEDVSVTPLELHLAKNQGQPERRRRPLQSLRQKACHEKSK
jgi:uncharacterized membrane protein